MEDGGKSSSFFLYIDMIKIDYAKTNSDGSITIKATYNDTT